MQESESIIAAHMGEDFLKLTALLQQAHTGKKKLSGFAVVERGGFIAKCICNIFNFPKQNPKCWLAVNCVHQSNSMTWKRDFNGLKMTSHFGENGAFLIEYLGPLVLLFKAKENNGCLEYRYSKTRLFGVPLPNFLSPQVKASEKEIDGCYCFSVEVTMLLIGMVISYSGKLALESND